jgi:hypothetical protein
VRSSDARYFQVRRTKREVNLWDELGPAIAAAKRDGDMNPALSDMLERSAEEYTHVLLACGRTAHDFRRNFRRGCAAHNVVEAREIAPVDILLRVQLDGFKMLRLTREQHWNVKERMGKVRAQDALVHDPQGRVWKELIAASIAGASVDNIDIFDSLIEHRVKLVDWNSPFDQVDMLVKEMERRLRAGASRPVTEENPEWSPIKAANIALRAYVAIKKLRGYEPDGIHTFSRADVRKELEAQLVIVEAYVEGRNVRVAYCDPDTSGRHCSEARLFARLSRVEDRLIELGDSDIRYYTSLRA